MRWLIGLGLLTGCELVFPLDPGVLVCGGNTPNALFAGCIQSPTTELPPSPLVVTGSASDPSDPGDCVRIVEQENLERTELCVVVAERIELGNMIAVGTRPLLLVSATDLRVTGTLSVGSRLGEPPGAGANFATCPTTQIAGDDGLNQAGGGGAGGSFATVGGVGGFAGGGDNPGGNPLLDPAPLTFVRGGCLGGAGGNSGAASLGGLGGDGGGAMYLIAGGTITIEGLLDASGAGGEHGDPGNLVDAGGGGGGGGAGGLIALDAPSVVIAAGAKLIANGGGGGAGGPGTGTTTSDGSSPDPTALPFVAAGGSSDGAGNGGDGANVDAESVNGNSTDAPRGAGGGGGGGLGHILVFSPDLADASEASPAIEPR